MRVLYLTNIPSPYMVDYLNELGKLCQLTAVFERAGSGVRDRSWKDWKFENFRGIILRGINIKVNEDLDDQAICPQVINYIERKKYDAIVVCNPCTPTGMIAIAYMKLRRISYGIQSEGGFPKDGKGLKEMIKRITMRDANYYFTTAEIGDQYALMYGAQRDKIYRYPFSSLYKREVLDKLVSDEKKKEIKAELDIPYEKVVLSVGRYIPVKGFDVLIKAYAGLEESIGLYIIGGRPTEEYLHLKETLGIKNLHFVDFQEKENIKKYYMASDVFALNSRGDTWGLVINEAMSYGLPVVSTNMCYAALALIENEKNGYVVEVDDQRAFTEKINVLLNDRTLCRAIGKNNLEKSKQYTLEEMAARVSEVLSYVCSGGKKQN